MVNVKLIQTYQNSRALVRMVIMEKNVNMVNTYFFLNLMLVQTKFFAQLFIQLKQFIFFQIYKFSLLLIKYSYFAPYRFSKLCLVDVLNFQYFVLNYLKQIRNNQNKSTKLEGVFLQTKQLSQLNILIKFFLKIPFIVIYFITEYCKQLNPCKNSGTCKMDTNSFKGYQCLCSSGFHGENCQKGKLKKPIKE